MTATAAATVAGHFVSQRRSRSRYRTRSAYTPTENVFRNSRPLAEPTVTGMMTPPASARAAVSTSVIPSRRAKWFSVPVGRGARAVRRPSNASAAVDNVPSPPATATTRAPASAAEITASASRSGGTTRRSATTPARSSVPVNRRRTLSPPRPASTLRKTGTAPLAAPSRCGTRSARYRSITRPWHILSVAEPSRAARRPSSRIPFRGPQERCPCGIFAALAVTARGRPAGGLCPAQAAPCPDACRFGSFRAPGAVLTASVLNSNGH